MGGTEAAIAGIVATVLSTAASTWTYYDQERRKKASERRASQLQRAGMKEQKKEGRLSRQAAEEQEKAMRQAMAKQGVLETRQKARWATMRSRGLFGTGLLGSSTGPAGATTLSSTLGGA